MPTQRTSLNVSFTPEPGALIAAELSSGRYQTANEVVRAALRLLQKAERAKPGPAGAAPRGAAPRVHEAAP